MSRALDQRQAARCAESYDTHTFELYGVAYPCSVGAPQEDTIYGDGGKILSASAPVFLRKELLPAQVTADMGALTADSDTVTADDFTPPPRSGPRCKLDNQEYRIGQVRDLISVFRIQLKDPDSDR